MTGSRGLSHVSASATVTNAGVLMAGMPSLGGQRTQRDQQGLKLLAAITATFQVVLHQGQRLGRVPPGQCQLDETIQLLETLAAPDFVWSGGEHVVYHTFESNLFKQHTCSPCLQTR